MSIVTPATATKTIPGARRDPELGPATHILIKEEFRDESTWAKILESHGIKWGDNEPEPTEICIRATVEWYETDFH